MHEISIMKTFVGRGEFYQIAEVVAYLKFRSWSILRIF